VIGVATKKAWSKRKPKVNHIKIFGYIAYKVVTGKTRFRFDPTFSKLLFVGYFIQEKHIGFWILVQIMLL